MEKKIVMPIKIKSRVKEVMAQKGLGVKEVSDAAGLPHVVIVNACSEKIEFCGLGMLNKIASALDVSIKDLFEEILPVKKAAPIRKSSMSCEISISAVTEQLLTTITKLSTTDKDRLLGKLNELKKTPGKMLDVNYRMI
jgi:DNA-binding Xre family transcriptional regulator